MSFKFDIKPHGPQKSWKETIIERIHEGKVLPIIGSALTNDLAFKSHQALIEGWAQYLNYPGPCQPSDLPEIAQYESLNRAGETQSNDELQIKKDFLTFLKEALLYLAREEAGLAEEYEAELHEQTRELSVSRLAEQLNYPTLQSAQANPLLLLADLPLPLYLTTSPHHFIEASLHKAGKAPQTDFCRWHPALAKGSLELDREYSLDPHRPLVYHLFGLDGNPASLVLTEDDHLDFLTYISRYHQSAIPAQITSALTTCSLVLLGFQLRGWDFRVLFRGVIKPRPQSLRLANVAIQLEDTTFQKELVKKYLRQVNFEVEWSPPAAFIRELYQGYMR